MLNRRKLLAAVVALVAAVAAVVTIGALGRPHGARSADQAAAPSGAIPRYQRLLRDSPRDHRTWAALGAAYVQEARTTLDPSYYTRAEGAFRRSLELAPDENPGALTGMAALANARHAFREAARWGERAVAASPSSPDAHGALADAYTQLGDAPAATRAVARMTELAPDVPALTRASYDAQQHGDTAAARTLLEQAARVAHRPADVAYAQYYLGELAFHAGDLDGADRRYVAAAAAEPASAPAAQGRAKVRALRGDLAGAAAGYAALVARAPHPQYLMEYAGVLRAAGRGAEAARQDAVLRAQERLLAGGGLTDDLAASEYAADAGDAAGALRHARAEAGRRSSVLVADALAWALHLNGRDREALPHADRALAHGWRNASFHLHRAAIRAALGDAAGARGDRAAARSINPRLDPRLPALGRSS
ncbi:tetratricopeptide repeat protein [Actinomadura flavalba]|uniref:tetratricopeptide repeat protein n=1 Tax=Actinomadura flavalba TaxID=1120938 RepID=UPI00036DBD24|nr:tetratricopeptide repeat protein [Actinomadura flavalba]